MRGLPFSWGNINFLLRYLPYFIIGVMLGGNDLRFNIPQREYTIGGLIAILVLSVFLESHLSPCYKRLFQVMFYALLPMTIIALFQYISDLPCLNDNRMLQNLDRMSMGIYIVHHIYIQEINASSVFHRWMMDYPYLYPVVLFFVVLLLSIITVWGIQRFKWGKYIVG